jgi:NAD(P)-dependent dehydrogenase (short-subunit alcohol dehydrogenase family)
LAILAWAKKSPSAWEASVPRTIVITGTSGGFGKLCVERFAAEGWNVVATVRKDTDPTAHLSKTRKARS